MTTNVTLHQGHDVAYFTRGQHRGGCAGAMSYYTAAGEPSGEWAGKGAAALGLSGRVDADVIEQLYQENIGPGGELLVKRRQAKKAQDREAAAAAAYLATHPYASATELAEVRAAARGKDPHSVPYFDLTVSAVKSVSVLHASYRVAARQARHRGDHDRAAALDARADEIEAALLDSAREAVAWLEQHATYTRTGHHSARTGEWRDGGGLAASLFLHHLSRDGDPQLHVHVAIWNRVQRADGADAKWRTLDSRSLHNQRLGVAPVADRILETKLSALGYGMVPRTDGNGAEVGGVSQDVMDLFSSRAVAVTGELAVGGRSGTEVVQVTAPDLADVTGLGVRASDGGSIYRPPNEERYCTRAHLDVEEQILAAAKRALPRLVEDEQARTAVERTGLNAEQRDAVAMMLTATAATVLLVAPAGAGKSHTMAEFARLWTTFTGRRVIGLTTSATASRPVRRQPGRRRRPGPRPSQHADRRRRTPPCQP
jgi:conjugative relaxase-like TrwC/TraI family protein